MILLSLVLVIAAAVLLVLGWFQDGLELIYLSIGACLLAMLLLGASVLQRRRGAGTAPTSPLSGGTAPASAAGDTSRRTAVVRRSSLEADTTAAAARTATADGDADEDVAADEAAAGEPADAEPEPADPLSGVRGLGPGRREALLARFGDVDAIRNADVAELTEVPGVSPGLAKAVKDHLA